MQIGDTVYRETVHPTLKGEHIKPCKVVYIHPEGRYHTVQFDFPGGSFKESYLGVSD